jgi:hypothetical protein
VVPWEGKLGHNHTYQVSPTAYPKSLGCKINSDGVVLITLLTVVVAHQQCRCLEQQELLHGKLGRALLNSFFLRAIRGSYIQHSRTRHVRTRPEEAGSPAVSTLYTKDLQRKKITNRYMGILVSSASLASCLPRRRSKRRKERRRKTNGPESGVAPSLIHSFMDLGSGSPKTKPSTLWCIGRGDAPKPTPDSGSAATARRRRWGKADPPAIFLKPNVNPADLQPPPTPPEGERRSSS